MTEITLYSTRTRRKERLEPIDPDRVRLYACGPTVYDRAHIGNARSAVVFDLLFRVLRDAYGTDHVTYVRNFTDVDDKINARSAATGREIREITDETIGWYRADMAALGCLTPSAEPRCTEFIPEMIAMCETLIAGGHAYAAEGHVLFSVGSYDGYGSLARRSLDEMQAGARVEVAPWKRDPMDFVLWKPSTPEQPGWESPWGRGRPGWHIECSAMAKALLGDVFDIHGGGIDLAFPHHENEVAQSCCANGTERMANIWMHNGFLMVGGEKMSKSLGNFFTVRDLLDQGVPGEVMRLVLLSTQYRQPLDWTDAKVEEAGVLLARWRRVLDTMRSMRIDPRAPGEDAPDEVIAALHDDLNTPAAIQALDAVARAVLDNATPGREDLARSFGAGLGLMGFEGLESALELVSRQKNLLSGDIATRIDAALAERLAARKARDFARADAIRNALAAAGVMVKDTGQGSEWELSPAFDAARLEEL